MTDTLRSNLSDVEVLLADLPERPFPTYDNLTHADFLKKHLIPNTPFLLSCSATKSWASRKCWRIPPSDDSPGPSRPNLTALRQYGLHVVPVANTARREFSEFERTERPLVEVLDLWERCDGVESDGGAGLYVKDWHLLAEVESAGGGAEDVYIVPECFREDWLNPAYTPGPRFASRPHSPGRTQTTSLADFRFTYLGPRGTFTPLHRDVYTSYSWSANIAGRKLWWLFPPEPRVLRKLGIGQRGGDGDGPDDVVFDVREIVGDVGGIRILQEEGEIIFVPSGWYHQVVNLDFSRLGVMAAETTTKVEGHPSTVPEWEIEWVEEVQKLLEMDAGWGWKGFWECVRDNVQSPPALPHHSTPIVMRNDFIREVIAQFRSRREWVVLPEVREIISQIMAAIS